MRSASGVRRGTRLKAGKVQDDDKPVPRQAGPNGTLLWAHGLIMTNTDTLSWAPQNNQGTTFRLLLPVTGEVPQLAISPRGYEATCEGPHYASRRAR